MCSRKMKLLYLTGQAWSWWVLLHWLRFMGRITLGFEAS
ncbi:hypothetical protein LINPERPRIM_LOCUS11248 [Linum perenne]